MTLFLTGKKDDNKLNGSYLHVSSLLPLPAFPEPFSS